MRVLTALCVALGATALAGSAPDGNVRWLKFDVAVAASAKMAGMPVCVYAVADKTGGGC